MVLRFVQETQNTHKEHSSELGNRRKECLKQDVQMDVLLYYVQEYIQQGRQCTNNVNIEVCSCNHCCSGKVISITYSERVLVSLGIQHTMCIVSYCHLWPAKLHNIFPHYLINSRLKKKRNMKDKMCVLIFPTTFV